MKVKSVLSSPQEKELIKLSKFILIRFSQKEKCNVLQFKSFFAKWKNMLHGINLFLRTNTIYSLKNGKYYVCCQKIFSAREK